MARKFSPHFHHLDNKEVIEIHGPQFQLHHGVLTSSQERHADEKGCVLVFYCCITNYHKLSSLN